MRVHLPVRQAHVSALAKQGFNPQPEPPKLQAAQVSDLAKKGFNPQPEPPKGIGPVVQFLLRLFR